MSLDDDERMSQLNSKDSVINKSLKRLDNLNVYLLEDECSPLSKSAKYDLLQFLRVCDIPHYGTYPKLTAYEDGTIFYRTRIGTSSKSLIVHFKGNGNLRFSYWEKSIGDSVTERDDTIQGLIKFIGHRLKDLELT